MSNTINDFIAADNDKIDKLIAENPQSISISDISAFLGADVASVRAAIENNIFGMSWRKSGSARHGYFIPTAQFVRWYLAMN
ncbi:MAG: hypothetical protein MJ168_12290 [Clostridia bacterium]|nr:hypothetical protein [Clostridia bacterium]